ncbi:MAG TPA: hypothetical protein DCS39_03545 [Rhodobiaceae bacterium]|nr:hypothetical protein [Rhodobiaceae bacterium]|tara:strand:+ start:992 stop:1240 length:249 start_codon:yes stop_codon:yes gene_type:complete
MSDKPEISIAGRRFIRTLLIICAGLLVAEFIIHRHTYFALEATPLFFALFGFAAFCIVVGGGVLLRKLVMRAPDYYDGDDDA